VCFLQVGSRLHPVFRAGFYLALQVGSRLRSPLPRRRLSRGEQPLEAFISPSEALRTGHTRTHNNTWAKPFKPRREQAVPSVYNKV
jgi:hypothetical protein